MELRPEAIQDARVRSGRQVVIRLEPTSAGAARVRFAGKILGYERAYEILIDVVEKK